MSTVLAQEATIMLAMGKHIKGFLQQIATGRQHAAGQRKHMTAPCYGYAIDTSSNPEGLTCISCWPSASEPSATNSMATSTSLLGSAASGLLCAGASRPHSSAGHNSKHEIAKCLQKIGMSRDVKAKGLPLRITEGIPSASR